MRLISIQDIADSDNNDAIFRTSIRADLIVFIIFTGLLLACFGHFIWYFIEGVVRAIWFIGYLWFAGTFLLLICFAHKRLRAGRLPSNWLLKANSTRGLIKFRSFQNYYYPETDRIVIDLSWRDIVWVRKTKETSTKPGSDGVVTQFFTYLDIKLNLSEQELKEIETALARERNTKPLMTKVGELYGELFQARKKKAAKHEIEEIKQRIKLQKKVKTDKRKSGGKHHDYPVSLVNNDILRLRWNGIKPDIKAALACLSVYTQVEADIKIKTDSTGKLEGKAFDDLILDRIAKGDIIDATRLARQHYGYSTTEAKQFVDELMNKSSG